MFRHNGLNRHVHLLYTALIGSLIALSTIASPVSAQESVVDGQVSAPVDEASAELIPPLPFNGPQVGPIIKPGDPDDVNSWTTAFIPTDLNFLSKSELPTTDERWIRVDLSAQTVVAYEGSRAIRGFTVSTGLPDTPTVTGEFRIRTKVRSQTMSGGSPALGTYYNLPGVEWVQYFYEDYGFHGTYWHNDFGTPKSHGCINMTNSDAKWLFDWAGPKWDGQTTWYPSANDNPGTLVVVHD